MKKNAFVLAALAVGLTSSLPAFAGENTKITLYGNVDAGVRYESGVSRLTNPASVNGFKSTGVQAGSLTDSYIGFKGQEDLGNGTAVTFKVEADFDIANGQQITAGRTFGRDVTVGLRDDQYGNFDLGRQTNLAYDFVASTDIYGAANNAAIAGYQMTATNKRWDNSVKYTNKLGNFDFGAQYGFGTVLGQPSSDTAYGVSLGYQESNWSLNSVYQRTHGRVVPVGVVAVDNVDYTGVGGTYSLASAPVKITAQIVNIDNDTQNVKNQIYTLGGSWAISKNVDVLGAYTRDKQSGLIDGTRDTYSATAVYKLSKRTSLYTEIDHNKIKGGYVNPTYSLVTAKPTLTGVTVGMKHSF